jgi:hypothetical protein
MVYSDGYGLNFYTREYGYYEYCENHLNDAVRKAANGVAASLGTGIPLFFMGIAFYFCCR